jgi:2-C-methyl-D-erythritol 4-phosphate cytidylyltransferase/2-C-methyl-D-erythritol 2,4-cyclodiphosphate synthase
MSRDFAVILPAAGSSSRFSTSGGTSDKLLEPLGGISVLARSLALFAGRPDVAHITLVTSPDKIPAYREHLSQSCPPAAPALTFIPGGDARWQSVLNGLQHLASLPAPPTYVGIHDAARPLCPQSVIDEAFATTRRRGAALPCLPEPATLKRRNADGTVAETVDRAQFFQAQTPQCFTLAPLLAAYQKLLAQDRTSDLTDDAQVYERTGLPVPITQGSPLNLKITLAQDLTLAAALLQGS